MLCRMHAGKCMPSLVSLAALLSEIFQESGWDRFTPKLGAGLAVWWASQMEVLPISQCTDSALNLGVFLDAPGITLISPPPYDSTHVTILSQ